MQNTVNKVNSEHENKDIKRKSKRHSAYYPQSSRSVAWILLKSILEIIKMIVKIFILSSFKLVEWLVESNVISTYSWFVRINSQLIKLLLIDC